MLQLIKFSKEGWQAMQPHAGCSDYTGGSGAFPSQNRPITDEFAGWHGRFSRQRPKGYFFCRKGRKLEEPVSLGAFVQQLHSF